MCGHRLGRNLGGGSCLHGLIMLNYKVCGEVLKSYNLEDGWKEYLSRWCEMGKKGKN